MNMFGKNEMPFQKKTSLQRQMTRWLQLRNIARMAHSLFVQKIAHVKWGKFWIGHAIRLVYAEGFRSSWLVSCFQSRPELSFISFQTASCLQLLRHTPLWQPSWKDNGGLWNTQEPRGVKHQSGGINCRVAGVGNPCDQGRTPVSFSSFTNSAIMTCDNSVDPSVRIKALLAASLSK